MPIPSRPTSAADNVPTLVRRTLAPAALLLLVAAGVLVVPDAEPEPEEVIAGEVAVPVLVDAGEVAGGVDVERPVVEESGMDVAPETVIQGQILGGRGNDVAGTHLRHTRPAGAGRRLGGPQPCSLPADSSSPPSGRSSTCTRRSGPSCLVSEFVQFVCSFIQ